MTTSCLEEGMEVTSMSWPNDEYMEVGKHGVEKILVVKLAGPMGFYDAVEAYRSNDHGGHLVVPVHQLSDISVEKK